jgi:predicted dehydrogenase
MLVALEPDVVDVITPESTHREYVELALRQGCAVVCQKPFAPSLEDAIAMLEAARRAQRPLLINENWRWQAPIRALKDVLESGRIGDLFRARLQFSCSFPVFDNQPALKRAPCFILLDLGTHLLDVARFLAGEPDRLFATTSTVTPGIRGEDVATLLLRHTTAQTTIELSYASRLADERFPETFATLEGTRGSAELRPGPDLVVTTADGVERTRIVVPSFAWADPAYAQVHASIVPCQADLLGHLRGEHRAETTAEDNLRTLRLVMAAYESAASGQAVVV